MKIEEFKPVTNIETNSEAKNNTVGDSDMFRKEYWFPLPKGYNRILIVLSCLIIIYFVNEYPAKGETLLFTLFIEVAVYVACVWIYRGFKELPKNEL